MQPSLADTAEPIDTPPPERARAPESKPTGAAGNAPSAPSASAEPLSLEELFQIALQSNPTLAQAAMAVEAAEGGYVQAGLYPNPALNYIADEVGNDGTEGLQGMGFSQEVVTKHKRLLAQAAASFQVEQARHVLEAQWRRVLNDVRAGYYDVLLAQKMIDLNNQLVRIGNEGVAAAEKLLAAKAVSRTDVLQAHIEANMAKLGLNQARNRHQGAWRRLAAVLGQPEMPPQPLAGDVEANLPDFQWEDTLTQLLTQSPELARAQAGVEGARSELDLQCANRFPNFDVEAAAKYDTGSYYTVADVGVSIPLPIFDRNQGNILAAQSNWIAAQKEVQRVELDLRNRLASAFEQYANAQRQVETYTRSILPDAKTSLDLVSIGYRQGEFGYLTLLMAQRTYFRANLDYLSALQELWARSVQLEGLLLSGGLDRPE